MPGTISPAVRHTIKLCLEKNPSKRISDIRDVRFALDGTFESGISDPLASEATAQRSLKRVVLFTAAVIAGSAGWSLRPAPPPGPVNRFDYDLPAGQSLRYPQTPMSALSRDGRYFVYNTPEGLCLRSLGELGARLIFGTEGQELTTPVLSPDAQSVAYFALPNELKRIAVSGGASLVITNEVGPPFGAYWASDGTIVYGQDMGIYVVPANGGKPELIIPAETGGCRPTVRGQRSEMALPRATYGYGR